MTHQIHTAENLGFTEANISSICKRYNASARDKLLADTQKGMDASAGELNILMTEVGFSAANIASMLNGAGQKIDQAIEALTSDISIAGFNRLIPEVFTANNTSSILNGAGFRVEQGVVILVSKLDQLAEILIADESPGIFTAENLASVLSASGKKLESNIDAVFQRQDDIIHMLSTYQPREISAKLHRKASKGLATAIDELYDVLLPEIIATAPSQPTGKNTIIEEASNVSQEVSSMRGK